MKKGYKRLTREDFDNIKDLLNHGYSYRKISKITSRASSTISYINNADSYEDYRGFVTEVNNRNRKKTDQAQEEDYNFRDTDFYKTYYKTYPNSRENRVLEELVKFNEKIIEILKD